MLVPKQVLLSTSFQTSLIYTVKSFLMNEIEIVFFSIYLEKINWLTGLIGLQDNLMLTALYVKVIILMKIFYKQIEYIFFHDN